MFCQTITKLSADYISVTINDTKKVKGAIRFSYKCPTHNYNKIFGYIPESANPSNKPSCDYDEIFGQSVGRINI